MRLTQLRPIGLVIAFALVAGAGLAATAGRQPPADPPPAPEPGAPPRPAPVPAPAASRRLAVERHDCPNVDVAAFSPDGSVVVVAGWKPADAEVENVLTLWDAATGKHLRTFRGPDAGGGAFTFSPDGKRLAHPSTTENEVILREVASGKELHRLPHQFVSAADFSPDGKRVATTSSAFAGKETHSELHVWDVTTGRRVFSPALGADGAFLWAFFAPDGRLTAGTQAGRVRRWNSATGREEPPLALPMEPGRYVLPAADGSAFVGTPGGRPTVYDGATGRVVRAFGRAGEEYEFAHLFDGAKRLVAADKRGRAVTWDAATGQELGAFTIAAPGGANSGEFVRPTADGRYLLASSSEKTADGTDTIPSAAVYTPDGKLVRRARGVAELDFDAAGRSVVVLTRTPSTADAPPKYDVTVHPAAAWLAGGAKKE